MFRTSLAVLAVTAGSALAQTAPAVITTPPAPEGVCYYAGLAYSPEALLTVEVPFRRESPQATQKRLLKCAALEDGETLGWVVFTLE